MRARFHEEVGPEADEAIEFYESDSTEAADNFEAELRRIVKEIRSNPKLGSPIAGDARRRILQGFPYSIVYQIRPDHVYIVAVAHFSRQWGYWLHRLLPTR